MASTPHTTQDILLSEDGIRLGQLLKLVSAVEDGQEAKTVITEGMVKVNNDIETRRGAQLREGDVIAFNGEAWRITVDA